MAPDAPTPDPSPHSRACGWRAHPHGPECSPNCPTCHGLPIGLSGPTVAETPETPTPSLADEIDEWAQIIERGLAGDIVPSDTLRAAAAQLRQLDRIKAAAPHRGDAMWLVGLLRIGGASEAVQSEAADVLARLSDALEADDG